jgi:chromosome segregation ATPase
MVAREEFITKDDLEKSLGKFKEEIIHEFHVVSEGMMDHIKLLAEGHSGVVQKLDRVETRLEGVENRLDKVEIRLDHMETRLDHMEAENERQHMETRSLIKLSFSELDNRLSSLELQVKELQEWRKQVQDRLQI